MPPTHPDHLPDTDPTSRAAAARAALREHFRRSKFGDETDAYAAFLALHTARGDDPDTCTSDPLCQGAAARADKIADLVDQLIADALHAAAYRIEAELICCPDDQPAPGHHICRWAIASRHLVHDQLPPGHAPTLAPDRPHPGPHRGDPMTHPDTPDHVPSRPGDAAPFVALRGGLVESASPEVRVLDLDVLDTDTVDDLTIEDARNLRDQIHATESVAVTDDDRVYLRGLLAEVNRWLVRHTGSDA